MENDVIWKVRKNRHDGKTGIGGQRANNPAARAATFQAAPVMLPVAAKYPFYATQRTSLRNSRPIIAVFIVVYNGDSGIVIRE